MKVADYVRFNFYRISTPIHISQIRDKEYDNQERCNLYRTNDGFVLTDANIIKSSPNIIDLIEKNDYVNGNLVSFVGTDSIEVFWYKDEKQWLDKEDINTIVTKEQFSQMDYEVK